MTSSIVVIWLKMSTCGAEAVAVKGSGERSARGTAGGVVGRARHLVSGRQQVLQQRVQHAELATCDEEDRGASVCERRRGGAGGGPEQSLTDLAATRYRW